MLIWVGSHWLSTGMLGENLKGLKAGQGPSEGPVCETGALLGVRLVRKSWADR